MNNKFKKSLFVKCRHTECAFNDPDSEDCTIPLADLSLLFQHVLILRDCKDVFLFKTLLEIVTTQGAYVLEQQGLKVPEDPTPEFVLKNLGDKYPLELMRTVVDATTAQDVRDLYS